MRYVARAAAVAVILYASAPLAAGAYDPSLSAAQIRSAIAVGRAAAKSHEGLSAQAYTAFATSDALEASPHGGSIDAVVVGTPFERVEYAAYVAAFERRTASVDEISDASTPQTLDVVVFAHSRDPLDQGFLRRFHGATLTVGSVKHNPLSVMLTPPTKDFFNSPSGRQLLWLGDMTYRFDMRGVKPDAVVTFSVIDPYARAYDVPLDLSKYR